MRASRIIEKYFWIILTGGIVAGIWLPLTFSIPPWMPKLLLGMMLFLVFLKIDALEILENLKNYKMLIYISSLYMLVIPVIFYFTINIFDPLLATGILLLTAMPAGVSTPALADMLKGNIPLAMSIAIVTQLLAPFTVPLLFWLIDFKDLEINKLMVLKDIAVLVFVPLISAQAVKRLFPVIVKNNLHIITSLNVFILFSFVYITISSQSGTITENPVSLIWKTVILYIVFILLHLIGYFIRPGSSREDRITFSVTSAYMNNGLAIVIAATYFSPDILVLMVLSEIPWNTLLGPFRKITSGIKHVTR